MRYRQLRTMKERSLGKVDGLNGLLFPCMKRVFEWAQTEFVHYDRCDAPDCLKCTEIDD